MNRNQRQYAYYLTTGRKLPAAWSISNEATPRYFEQDFYKTGDSKYLFEDTTTLSKTVNDWFSFGASQWTQVEWHENTATGTSVDAGLFGKFSFFGGLSFETRLWTPLAVRNTVNDAASVVSLRAMRAEMIAQLAL